MSLSELLHEPMFWAGVAGVCALILLALSVPEDAGIKHDDNEPPPPPPPVFGPW